MRDGRKLIESMSDQQKETFIEDYRGKEHMHSKELDDRTKSLLCFQISYHCFAELLAPTYSREEGTN